MSIKIASRAPSGVRVYTNSPQPKDRWRDEYASVHRLWSLKFVCGKIIRSFRARRSDGFLLQSYGYLSTWQAEQDWTDRIRNRTGIKDVQVNYDGLKWVIVGSVNEVPFTGGTVGLSKRAGRTHREWRVCWPGEKWDDVVPSASPDGAVQDAVDRRWEGRLDHDAE